MHLPVTVTLCTAAFTRKGWLYCIAHVLFENGMSVVKVWAVLNGMFNLGRAQEWVVTQKAGSSDNRPTSALQVLRSCRAYFQECALGVFLLTSATFAVFWTNRVTFSIFLTVQGKHEYATYRCTQSICS